MKKLLIGFIYSHPLNLALAVLGVVLITVEGLRPTTGDMAGPAGMFGLLLLFLGAVGAFGSFVVWLVSWIVSLVADRKRAGKESSLISPRSVVPARRSLKDYALAMAPVRVFIIVALFLTGVLGGPPDGPYEEYFENGQLAGKGTYNSELGDWRFGELVGEIS